MTGVQTCALPIFVIEDKAKVEDQAKYLKDNETLLMDTSSVTKYAENGALHYALSIIQNTNFKKVIAFGCSGTDEKRIVIRPIYVSPTGYKILPKVKDFNQFSTENIERYYNEIICGNDSIERVELKTILSRAKTLHEDLRNYGQLGDSEKPLVVSAILLALEEKDFSTESLNGDTVKTDGQKIFDAMSAHMERVKVEPQVKKQRVIDQFRLDRKSTRLNSSHTDSSRMPSSA